MKKYFDPVYFFDEFAHYCTLLQMNENIDNDLFEEQSCHIGRLLLLMEEFLTKEEQQHVLQGTNLLHPYSDTLASNIPTLKQYYLTCVLSHLKT